MAFAVIRVRGECEVNRDVEYTMNIMNLTRVNHCSIIPDNEVTKGMLQKTKDFITWGEVDETVLAEMIRIRGRLAGDKMITDAYLTENSEFKTIEEMAKGIINGYRMKDIEAVKPLFRLHPPKKGYEGIKRSYRNGGALGYRGEAINDLIKRML